MEINAKQAAALMKAKSFEEFSTVLADFAQVSEAETRVLFDKYHSCSELSDEELEKIVGGAMYDQNGKEVIDYYYDTKAANCGDLGRLYVKYADGTQRSFDGLTPEEMHIDPRISGAAYDAA